MGGRVDGMDARGCMSFVVAGLIRWCMCLSSCHSVVSVGRVNERVTTL